ncbi:MAG: BolA family transcriptional regulator [Dehalococcoidia bacterium]|jgi:BolA protein|nr:BolA family transcriptional regulator [Dehalococcoidia bacterium]
MNIEDTISNQLSNLITVSYLELKDSTGKHVHHDNFDGGLHLSAIIVSDDFNNLSLLERHQLVYNALGSMIKNEIHAFSMKTFTNSEWKRNVT